MSWDRGLSGLPVQAAPQPSQTAHRSGAEADPGSAPQEPQAGYGGAVAPAAAAGPGGCEGGAPQM